MRVEVIDPKKSDEGGFCYQYRRTLAVDITRPNAAEILLQEMMHRAVWDMNPQAVEHGPEFQAELWRVRHMIDFIVDKQPCCELAQP
jgi:hypothetical protein